MPGLTGLAGLIGLSGLVGGYPEKVLSYNPIAYWPLWETVGGTAVDLVNSPAQDGAYTGVTLGQTVTDANGVSFLCPLFDGANDYVNIHTATLAGAFDGDEGSMMIWARVFNVGVWTDGNNRASMMLFADAQNYVQTKKDNVNNVFEWYYEANNVLKQRNRLGLAETAWVNYAVTWSTSADEVRMYYTGVQEGATFIGLGGWTGVGLDNTRTVLGANDLAPLNALWYGWLAHSAIWDTALTPSQILDLATV